MIKVDDPVIRLKPEADMEEDLEAGTTHRQIIYVINESRKHTVELAPIENDDNQLVSVRLDKASARGFWWNADNKHWHYYL